MKFFNTALVWLSVLHFWFERNSLVSSDCIYTVGNVTLDLTNLDTTELDYTDSSGNTKFKYSYTPCRNGLTCNSGSDIDSNEVSVGEDYMATQTGNNCFYLAEWDDSVQPTYSDNTFTFTYANGQGGRVFVAEYKCGSDTGTITSVTESESTTSGVSTYTMTIETKYACNGGYSTTTTAPPVANCSWTTQYGYKLDLASLYGSIIQFSDEDDELTYYYTPCNNGLICIQNDEQGVANTTSKTLSMMTEMNDIGECDAYLAKFDYSIEPEYYSSTQTFAFSFNNGQSQSSNQCTSPLQTIIQWACSKNVTNGVYQVESISEVTPCIYNILINSPLACGTNDTYYK